MCPCVRFYGTSFPRRPICVYVGTQHKESMLLVLCATTTASLSFFFNVGPNSMEQNPSSKDNGPLASQQISRRLCNPRFRPVVITLVLTLGHINQVHAHPFYFCKIHCNIIPRLSLGLPYGSFLYTSSQKVLMYLFEK